MRLGNGNGGGYRMRAPQGRNGVFGQMHVIHAIHVQFQLQLQVQAAARGDADIPVVDAEQPVEEDA